jgi:hypothetical protein
MRLKFIVPAAGCTCLSAAAVAVEASNHPREEENLNLRRNRKQQNTSREQTRELQLFDDDDDEYYDDDDQSDTPSYRLKLYWESKYNWQGDDNDPFYCMGMFLSCPVCL